MTRPHGTDATGRPVDLIGQRLDTRPAPPPTLRVLNEKEMATMPKAEQDGVYTLNGGRFKVRAGDVLPEGAEMVGETEERAKAAAPGNKSKQAAPENRARKAE